LLNYLRVINFFVLADVLNDNKTKGCVNFADYGMSICPDRKSF
jgi:hypothetical protein